MIEKEVFVAHCGSLVDTGIFISNPDKENNASGHIVFVNGNTIVRRAFALAPGAIQAIGSLRNLKETFPVSDRKDYYQIWVEGDISAMCCWYNTGTNNYFSTFHAPKNYG